MLKLRAVNVVVGVLLTGCYTLQPVGGTTPHVGSRVAFDVNDAGRAALGDRMGAEVDQIQGLLVGTDTGGYLVAVSDVSRLHGGGQQVWAGEQVHVAPQYVGTAYERRFSAGRTIVAAAVGVGAVGLLVGQSLIGSGNPNPPNTAPADSNASVRIPRRHIKIPFRLTF